MLKHYRIIILIGALILLTQNSFFSQDFGRIKDTINSVILQKIKVPGEKNFSFVDIVDFNQKSEVYDSKGNSIKTVEEYWQSPNRSKMKRQVRKANGRGTAVQAACFVTINEPGEYYVKNIFNIKNERGRRAKPSVTYMLNINYPYLASEIRVRDKYYYSEKLSFSISTIEFNEPDKYSYQIVEKSSGNVVQNEKGPLVVLDTLLNSLSSVGKRFIIKGLYKGNTFKYLYNGDKTPHLSEWEIMVEKPSAAKLGDWVDPVPAGRPRVISADNPSAKKILYTLNAKTPDNQYVFVKPRIRNLRIVSDPPGIFENPRTVTLGAFDYIYFDYNKEFYDNLKYEGQDVKVTFEFVNIFGIREKYTSQGIIIK